VIVALLAVAAQVGGPASPPVAETALDLLVGSWTLVSREDRAADGTIVAEPTLGSDPLGFLVYDRQGNVAVQLMRRVRSEGDAATQVTRQSGGNNSVAAGGYDAYFGRYTFDARLNTVTHQLVGALSAADVGKSLTRHVAVSAGELRLWFTTTGSSGTPVTRTVVWRRAESSK
jgi:lipocalin-like protein